MSTNTETGGDASTKLEDLPTTDSGTVRKKDATQWMQGLGEPDPEAAKGAVVPKPSDHSGSTYPEEISNFRVTGSPEYITEMAKFVTWFLDFEGIDTRVEVNLQQVEDRDTGELQDDVYALYLSAAQRG